MSQYHRQKSIQEDVLGEGEGGETKKATGGESGTTYHHVLSTYYWLIIRETFFHQYIQRQIILVGAASSVGGLNQSQRPKFVAVSTLEDVQVNILPDLKSTQSIISLKTWQSQSQAVRCAEFHPGGRFWAVGSNSKTLRICQYPDVAELRWNDYPSMSIVQHWLHKFYHFAGRATQRTSRRWCSREQNTTKARSTA